MLDFINSTAILTCKLVGTPSADDGHSSQHAPESGQPELIPPHAVAVVKPPVPLTEKAEDTLLSGLNHDCWSPDKVLHAIGSSMN